MESPSMKNLNRMTGISSTLVWHRPSRALPKIDNEEADDGQTVVRVLFFLPDGGHAFSGLWEIVQRQFITNAGRYLKPEDVEWWTYAPKKPEPQGK